MGDDAEMIRQLEAARVRSAPIEQAQGMLMATQRCTADQAFVIVRCLSKETNRKLHDVAGDLIRPTQRLT